MPLLYEGAEIGWNERSTWNVVAMPTFDSRPLWIRARPVAHSLGLTMPALESAIATGQIPLRTMALGRREILYVNSLDLDRYHSTFGGIDARHTHQR